MSKGLEALEEIKETLSQLDTSFYSKESLNTIEKELKALEIMTKSLDIKEEDFFYDDKENVYYFIGSEIPKEEYDLLKEVLLWD